MHSRLPLLAALLALIALAVAGCGNSSRGSAGGSSSSGGAGHISLVAYSTPQAAYEDVISAFDKTSSGKGASFSQSYGPSGDQARSVLAGLPADYVGFSLAPDMDKLAEKGIVAKNWADTPTHGFVTNSVVSLVVRKGNPKHITGWNDLLKPGVKVVTPNVFTSGSAKWNVMGAYGAALKEGKTPAQAKQWLADLYDHVSVQPKSGRDALQTFVGGEGDVLISYENEAITAVKKGEKVQYITPPQTILIQNPAAAVIKGGKNPTGAKAFLKFVTTPQAQKLFAAHGYRPVIPSLVDKKTFPTPKQLFTIDSLGGWSKVNDEFFDPDHSVMATIEQKKGVSTSG